MVEGQPFFLTTPCNVSWPPWALRKEASTSCCWVGDCLLSKGAQVTNGLLENAMNQSGKDNFLIDGFPRNDENRAAFEVRHRSIFATCGRIASLIPLTLHNFRVVDTTASVVVLE